AVHPDERRVTARTALLKRLVDVGRDVHVPDATAVGDLAVVEDTGAARLEDAVRARLSFDRPLVVRDRMILVAVAHIELGRTLRVHLNLLPLLPLDGQDAQHRQGEGDTCSDVTAEPGSSLQHRTMSTWV